MSVERDLPECPKALALRFYHPSEVSIQQLIWLSGFRGELEIVSNLLNDFSKHLVIQGDPRIFLEYSCKASLDLIPLDKIGIVEVHDGEGNCRSDLLLSGFALGQCRARRVATELPGRR